MSDTLIITKKHLCGDYPWGVNVKAHLFAELVKLVIPVIEQFHGDLFHDAAWIEKYVNGPRSFYWGCDHSGTVICGDDPANYAFACQARENVYHVQLIFEQNKFSREVTGQWYVTIKKVK